MPNPGHPSTLPGNRKGDATTRPPPLPPVKHGQSKGPEQETQEGTNRLDQPYQHPARGPREGRATKGNGGERRDHRGCASTQTHIGHTARTKRATGPSSRNAQTTWNGAPPGEDKGHRDGGTRHKQ